MVIAGITWCLGNGVSYGKTPASLGIQGATLRRRVIEWQDAGTWDGIVAAVTGTVLSLSVTEHAGRVGPPTQLPTGRRH
jgi:hypothetical protein